MFSGRDLAHFFNGQRRSIPRGSSSDSHCTPNELFRSERSDEKSERFSRDCSKCPYHLIN